MLRGTKFPTTEELLEAVIQILSNIPLKTLMATFHQRMDKLQAYIDGHGEHME
jgi:hypothetical protein